MSGDNELTLASFFLTCRLDAPQVPDFDGRGPRVCKIADIWVSGRGKEFWLVDVEPSIRSLDGTRSQVALAVRHSGVSLSEVFEGNLVYVHVGLVNDWDQFKMWIDEGLGTSEYWAEIVADRESVPEIPPRS